MGALHGPTVADVHSSLVMCFCSSISTADKLFEDDTQELSQEGLQEVMTKYTACTLLLMNSKPVYKQLTSYTVCIANPSFRFTPNEYAHSNIRDASCKLLAHLANISPVIC